MSKFFFTVLNWSHFKHRSGGHDLSAKLQGITLGNGRSKCIPNTYKQKCQLFSILMQHVDIFFPFRIEMKSRNRAEQKKKRCYSAGKCASARSFQADFILCCYQNCLMSVNSTCVSSQATIFSSIVMDV